MMFLIRADAIKSASHSKHAQCYFSHGVSLTDSVTVKNL